MESRCPNCVNERRPGQYLCPPCWRALSPAARRALNRRGDGAISRYQALIQQLGDRRPLADIEIPE